MPIIIPKLDKAERDRLWQAYRSDPENPDACAELAAANLPLVRKVINQQFRGLTSPDQIDDLEQEGFMALLRAIKFYRPGNNTFSTYAVKGIAESIRRYINQKTAVIRQPVHHVYVYAGYVRARTIFQMKHDRNPRNDQELAEFLGLDERTVRHAREYHRPKKLLSLDAPVGDGETPFMELVADRGRTPEEIFLAGEPDLPDPQVKAMREAIGSLSPREQEFLSLYAQKFTLQEIGDRHNLTRERIRQVIEKAIFRVRKRLGVDTNLPVEWPSRAEKTSRATREGVATKFLACLRRKEEEMLGTEGQPNREQPQLVHPDQPPLPTMPVCLDPIEFSLVKIVWPLLESGATTISLRAISDYSGLNRVLVHVSLASLADKGVLQRYGRATYMRGSPAILVEEIMYDLNALPLIAPTHLIEPERVAVKTTLTGQKLMTVPTSDQGHPALSTDRITEEVNRLESLRAEIDRRLSVLREAQEILNNPLPGYGT